VRRLLCVVLSLVLSSALLLADDGQIVGLVTDHNGETLPGVFVKVHRRGLTRTANTDAQGGFAFSVPRGQYKLSAKLPGFKAEPLKLTVTTGRTVTPLVVMHVAFGDAVSLAARAQQLNQEVRAAQR
jgi:hypothetical protein